MLIFECPSCKAKMKAAEEHAGKTTVCPKCNTSVKIPPSDAISAEPITVSPAATPDAITTPEQARAGKKSSNRPDDDEDDAPSRRRERTSSGNGAAAVGMGVGMILLIVGGVAGAGVCVIAILIALLVPAVQKVREAAARTQTLNNMKQISIAHHAHHDVFKKLPGPKLMQPPAGVVPAELSWRVAILPFIDEQPLFQQFDKTQAWDHPSNSPFLNRRPMQYDHLGRAVPDTTLTTFQYFTGPNTLYPEPPRPMRMADITDGTSNTFQFAEAQLPTPWSKPEDMAVTPNAPLPLPTDRFMAAMVDGSVRIVVRSKVNDQVLRLLIDPRDGQPLPADWDR